MIGGHLNVVGTWKRILLLGAIMLTLIILERRWRLWVLIGLILGCYSRGCWEINIYYF